MGMCLLLFSPGQAHALRDNRKLLFDDDIRFSFSRFLFGDAGHCVGDELTNLTCNHRCTNVAQIPCPPLELQSESENATDIDSVVEPLLDNRKLLFGPVGGAVQDRNVSFPVNYIGLDGICDCFLYPEKELPCPPICEPLDLPDETDNANQD